MNDKQRAASDLRKLQQWLKGIIDLGPDLEKLGSLEQAEQEARARLEELSGLETATKQRLATIKAEAETVRTEINAVADATRKQAEDDAARLIEEAKRQASVVDEATKEATDRLTALRLELGQTQNRLDQATAQLEALKARL